MLRFCCGPVALPSPYRRTAGPEFDKSSKKFCFFRTLELCFAPGISTSASVSDESFLFQPPNPLLQELPLWFLLGQRQSSRIRGPSLSYPAEPAVHICRADLLSSFKSGMFVYRKPGRGFR